MHGCCELMSRITRTAGPKGLDWRAWHRAYDSESDLQRRLSIVQKHVIAFLDEWPHSPARVVSMCAGEARDLLGALDGHPRRDVSGVLVELDPVLAGRAREHAERLGLTGLRVVVGDAGASAVYADAVPADLVLVCGVLGNISDADVETTIRALPELSAPGATVIWTRHRREPDLTPAIRRWLAEAGFKEMAFEGVPDSPASVGVARFTGVPLALAGRQLFTFNRELL